MIRIFLLFDIVHTPILKVKFSNIIINEIIQLVILNTKKLQYL